MVAKGQPKGEKVDSPWCERTDPRVPRIEVRFALEEHHVAANAQCPNVHRERVALASLGASADRSELRNVETQRQLAR